MMDSPPLIPENVVIIKDEYYYCVDNIIYKGNKSEIYKGREKSEQIISSTNSYDISFSICVKKEPPFLKYPELDIEFNILNYLQQFLQEDENGFIPCPFVPQIYNYYHNNDSPSFLIEKLYGNSLNAIFKMCKYNKEQTSDILSSKMIKKEINVDPHTQLYLIDYSSAKFYKENENNKHIKFTDKAKDFSFTNKNFCSIWAELKMEQSRRDDLYSLFYIMIYLFLGKLPWMDIKCKSKTERREKIRNLKLCLSNFELCQKIKLIISNEVELFAFYLNGLTFNDEPNYSYLNQLIIEMQRKVIKSQNEEYMYPVITIRN